MARYGQPFSRMIPAILGLLLLGGTAGCAHRVWNERLVDQAAGERYEFSSRLPKSSEDLFVVLAFSGGGTWAASFSFGVLRALRDTPVSVDGNKRRLLDEVDAVTSVSGGSYTAAYYGLYGERIFHDYIPDFLHRDWQGELMHLAARPGSLAAMASRSFNRSDLVAAHQNRTLFQGATFKEMSRNNLPFVIINASDINSAATFSFIQQQFDFLCFNISPYPVAQAQALLDRSPEYAGFLQDIRKQ